MIIPLILLFIILPRTGILRKIALSAISSSKRLLLSAIMVVGVAEVVILHTHPFAYHGRPLLIENLWPSLVILVATRPNGVRLGPPFLANTILGQEGIEKPIISLPFGRLAARHIVAFAPLRDRMVSPQSPSPRKRFDVDIRAVVDEGAARLTLGNSYLPTTCKQFCLVQIAAEYVT